MLISLNKSVVFAQIFHRHPLIQTIFQNCEESSLTISSNGTISIKFTHVLVATANALLHVTDKATKAGNLTAAAAGSNSCNSFISSCRRRSLPSSDLKLANFFDQGPVRSFAYSVKLVFSYILKEITAKFCASRRLRFDETKKIMSPEMRPKTFGTFEKRALDRICCHVCHSLVHHSFLENCLANHFLF